MPSAGSSNRGACHTEACAIQDCLANNNYDMNKCQDKVDKLKKCCSGSTMQESVHCAFLNSVPGTDSGASQSPDDQVLQLRTHCNTQLCDWLHVLCKTAWWPVLPQCNLSCNSSYLHGVQAFRSHSGTPSGGSKKQA